MLSPIYTLWNAVAILRPIPFDYAVEYGADGTFSRAWQLDAEATYAEPDLMLNTLHYLGRYADILRGVAAWAPGTPSDDLAFTVSYCLEDLANGRTDEFEIDSECLRLGVGEYFQKISDLGTQEDCKRDLSRAVAKTVPAPTVAEVHAYVEARRAVLGRT